MSVVEKLGVRRRLWTREEFYRLIEHNFFLNERVELLEGVILQMASQKNYHAMGIKLTEDALEAAFGPNFWVRVQMSLDLTPMSVLDPDIAVIAGGVRTHDPSFNPTTALLIVEVSETTLRYDRRSKASLYARAGIADYWILNLVQRQVEVYRSAVPDARQPYSFGYADVAVLSPGDHLTPLVLPQAHIAVADLMP
jgi:Uma2 family endonuclease